MKCPHCALEIHADFDDYHLDEDIDGHWAVYYMICPNPDCGKMIIEIAQGNDWGKESPEEAYNYLLDIQSRTTVYPLVITRNFAQRGIGDKFWNDYEEACRTLAVSPKASAALSRRCLQNILRDKAGVKKGDLSKEIQQVIDTGNLPSLLADSIDAIRNIGNFAAHPTKDKSTGEIVEVEPGEAEWLLDVLEDLMDFYFIQPQKAAERKAELNKKLEAVGKPPMK